MASEKHVFDPFWGMNTLKIQKFTNEFPHFPIWKVPKMGYPKMVGFIIENPTKMDDKRG